MSANKRTLPHVVSGAEHSSRAHTPRGSRIPSSRQRPFLQRLAQDREAQSSFCPDAESACRSSLGALLAGGRLEGTCLGAYLSEIVGSASGKSGPYLAVVAPRSARCRGCRDEHAVPMLYGTSKLPSTYRQASYTAATKT